MLKPEIGKLIGTCKNRYQLVLEVSKKAREIAKKAEENDEILLVKPVSLAIDEIAKEKNL